MGVDVDEAGGDNVTSGVEGTLGAFTKIADRDNPAVANSNIAAVSGKSRAIYDRAVSNDKIILRHSQVLLSLRWEKAANCRLCLLLSTPAGKTAYASGAWFVLPFPISSRKRKCPSAGRWQTVLENPFDHAPFDAVA